MNTAQILITGVDGPELGLEEARRLKELQPGGFILFGRNIKSPEQLSRLVSHLFEISKEPPLVCIDQEGGRVARLREIGREPPSAKELIDHGTVDHIRRHGQLTGQILKLFGFNLDLCPVLDISFEGDIDNSLRNRCYGHDPEEVTRNARAFNSALRAEGISSCGKHFPGYSRAHIDPHHELPSIERTREELENWEWVPFKNLLNEVDFQMIGHAFYPALDTSGFPSSLSHFFVTKMLREHLGYRGLVMTDDLDMGAIINQYSLKEAVHQSLIAGNDMVLLCHRNQLAPEAMEGINATPKRELESKLERIANWKKTLQAPPAFSQSKFDRINDEIFRLRAELIGEEKASRHSSEDGKRSPVEKY
jgi:beta-N-acetylhexosaminidase